MIRQDQIRVPDQDLVKERKKCREKIRKFLNHDLSLNCQDQNPDLAKNHQVSKENHGPRKKDCDQVQVQDLIPDPDHLITMKSYKKCHTKSHKVKSRKPIYLI